MGSKDPTDDDDDDDDDYDDDDDDDDDAGIGTCFFFKSLFLLAPPSSMTTRRKELSTLLSNKPWSHRTGVFPSAPHTPTLQLVMPVDFHQFVLLTHPRPLSALVTFFTQE